MISSDFIRKSLLYHLILIDEMFKIICFFFKFLLIFWLLISFKTDLLLVQTKKFKLSELSAENVFGSKSFNAYLQKGQIIGLEFAGTNSSQLCQNAVSQLKIDLGKNSKSC